MRCIFLCSFLCLSLFGTAQKLIQYRDTINAFTISIPEGWQYQAVPASKGLVKFAAYSPQNAGVFRANYNVIKIEFPNATLDSAYTSMLSSISARKGFKFIQRGDTTIAETRYIWLEELHDNEQTGEPMSAYIYLGYKYDNAYMLSFVSSVKDYPNMIELFRRIGTSFKL